MAKLDIKEVRPIRRDARSDDGDGPAAAAPERAQPPARTGEGAGLLRRPPVAKPIPPAPRPPSGAGLAFDLPSPPPVAPPPPASNPAASTSGDPFTILGTTFAETFRVESVVAHGGFAVVYRATHLRFAAPVALKCLKIPNNLTATERAEFLERFQKEGEVMFRLSSSIPEVVRPMQFDSFKMSDGRLVPFIALEWLEGETLKDVIVARLSAAKPPLSLAQAVTFLTPVARALARAHRLPSSEGPLCILHCDLKPDNIFVTTLGGVESLRIFDFGISKVRHAATRQVGSVTTDTQASMFTPAYAAPEQWTPDRYGQTGPWTDVFSLALTLTELSTQKPAIDGAPTAMLAQCINDKLRPTPRRLGLAIPDRIEAIFTRALAVDPRSRYQSISKFWGDLEEALGLPAVVGEAARASSAAFAAALDAPAPAGFGAATSSPAQAALAPQSGAAPRAGGGTPMFAGELDLPPPTSARAPASHAAPPASAPVPPSAAAGGLASGGSGLGLELELPAQGRAPSPAAPALAAMSPPAAAPLEEEPLDFGASLDLAAAPDRPAAMAPASTPMPAYAPQSPGMPVHVVDPMAPMDPAQQGVAQEPMPPPPPSVPTRERLTAAASKAGQVASVAAVTAAKAAATGAKVLATKALEVDQSHRIELADPSTWVKPMMGPIIAGCAAIAISVIAVIINKASGSNVSVMWISLPLMLAAIGFAVYRWNKITKE